MSSNTLPTEWATLCEKAGIRQSINGLADAVEKPASTIARLVATGRTSQGTVTAVAGALRVPEQRIWDLIQQSGHEGLGRWNPPPEAHDLNEEARDALNRLIRVMAKGERGWPAAGSSEESQPVVVNETEEATDPMAGDPPPSPASGQQSPPTVQD